MLLLELLDFFILSLFFYSFFLLFPFASCRGDALGNSSLEFSYLISPNIFHLRGILHTFPHSHFVAFGISTALFLITGFFRWQSPIISASEIWIFSTSIKRLLFAIVHSRKSRYRIKLDKFWREARWFLGPECFKNGQLIGGRMTNLYNNILIFRESGTGTGDICL